jgi:hypothetical protein
MINTYGIYTLAKAFHSAYGKLARIIVHIFYIKSREGNMCVHLTLPNKFTIKNRALWMERHQFCRAKCLDRRQSLMDR